MQDETKWTALMFAAMRGYMDCVKILAPIEKGLKNNLGETAKSIALRTHPECAEYLS